MAKKVTVKIKGEETVSKAAKKAKGGVAGLGKEVEKMQAGLRSSTIAIGAAIAAITGIALAVDRLIGAYEEQEEAEARFTAALQATGSQLQVSSQEMFAFAGELQKVTKFGDEVTISAAATLQSLANLSQEGLKQIIPLVQDFAVGMKIDLNTAMNLVGKTLGSTTNALSRYGVVLDATLPQSEKLAELTEVLEGKFGGMAEAVADTATGAMVQLKNAFSDLQESGGRLVAEALEPVTRWLTKIISDAASARQRLLELKELLSDAGWAEATSTYEGMAAALNTLAGEAAVIREEIKRIDVRLIFGKKEDLAEIEEAMETLRRSMRRLAEQRGLDADAAEAAAAKAAKEAAAAAALAKHMDLLNAAFSKTKAGREAALRAELAYWEKTLPFAIHTKDMVEAVIVMYQEQLQALIGIKEVGEELIVVYDEFGRVLQMAAINMANLSGLEARGVGTDRRLPSGALPAGTEAGGGGGMGGDVLASLAAAFMQIESLAMVLDPLTTIFETMAAVLEPLINTALAPLVGLLTVFGQMLGAMLMPVIEALTPIIQDLVNIIASFLMPVFILLTPIISIVTAAFDILAPVIQAVAVVFDVLMRPVEILAIVVGALISWLVALGTVIGYIVTFQWGKLGSVAAGPSFSEVMNEIGKILRRPPLEFGGQLAGVGAGVLEGEPGFEGLGGGGIGSSTTIQRAPDIFLTIHIENIYGAGGAEQAGMDIARVLREHALAGGQIFIQEAIAPMGA